MNIIFASPEQGLYPPYVNKSLNQAYIKDFVREPGSGLQKCYISCFIPTSTVSTTRTEHAQW